MIKHLVCACLLTCSATSAALAADDNTWGNASDEQFTGSRDQLALRVGIRTDESQSVDAQPEISLKYLRWLSRFTAITGDFGFTNQTDFSWNSEARTFTFGAGLRVREPVSLGSVYLEPGIVLLRHSGDLNGSDFTEARVGVSVSMGVSLNVYKGTALDISFRQVLDAGRRSRPVYTDAPGLPEPPVDQYQDFLGGADAYDLYNPTHLIVAYRIAL